MTKNSFLHPVNEIHFGTYKPGDVKDALADAIKHADAIEKAVLAIPDKDRTYENTIQAMNDSTDKFGLVSGVVGHLASVIDGTWDKADELASGKWANLAAKRSSNKKLYAAFKVIWDKRKELGLTDAQVRLVKDEITSFERGGISLPKDKQDRLKKIKARLAKLSSQFDRNATKATDKAHLIVKSADQLKGIGKDQIEHWQQAAKEKGVDGYFIQFSAPNYDVVMRQCAVQETRKAFHKVSGTRAAGNEKLIYEILSLRKELTSLLGYKNFVDLVVEQRMAKNSKAIKDFNDNLYKTFKSAMQKDSEDLKQFIRKTENNPNYELHATDIIGGLPLYYAQKMAAERFGVDENAVREYLPIDQVIKVMFDTLSTLYDVTIKESKEPVPHKDVKVYDIYDEKGRHLSTVWCDWFARKGKRGGAWCDTFYEAARNGKVDEPHLGVVCANFPPPTKTRPSLLSIRDVETAWHEFGHFMHASLSNTELREQGGFHTKWDFVEAPSQIMENWVWSEEIITKMAKHYKTGKTLPKDLTQKLIGSRSYWAAERVMWTLSLSTLDQELHTKYDPVKDGPLFEYCRNIKSRFFAAPVPEYDKTICTFSHIFSGGYYGAYYSYQWAEVIEADLFSRFEKEGILNPKTGRDYRDKVLARGDEVDPDQLVRDFLGRDFTPEALLKRSGL